MMSKRHSRPQSGPSVAEVMLVMSQAWCMSLTIECSMAVTASSNLIEGLRTGTQTVLVMRTFRLHARDSEPFQRRILHKQARLGRTISQSSSTKALLMTSQLNAEHDHPSEKEAKQYKPSKSGATSRTYHPS